MIVVADTFPLNYLILIDEIDLLSAVFGQVLVPQAVVRELAQEKTPLRGGPWSNLAKYLLHRFWLPPRIRRRIKMRGRSGSGASVNHRMGDRPSADRRPCGTA